MIYSELRYQPERTRTYLGSPSLVRLPDGTIVASHDYFGPGSPKNRDQAECLTSIYRSEDDGASWVNVTHVVGAFWSSLLIHHDNLYLFGTDCCYGSIVIRRSIDGGFTWTQPSDARNGLLFPGSPLDGAPHYHCAPVPVVVHEGRIYRAFENNITGQWPTGFRTLVISAPEASALLDAANWTMSNQLAPDPTVLPDGWGGEMGFGWLEGNIVVAPSGRLVNILRLYSEPEPDRAAMLRLESGGARLEFDPVSDLIEMPGGAHKFTIRHDPVSGLYYTLTNHNTVRGFFSQRNHLALAVSSDLRSWRVVKSVIVDESGLTEEDSLRLTGFQYADWQFDGDDLIALVRTAWRGAVSFHDSNRITFHRIKNFRRIDQ